MKATFTSIALLLMLAVPTHARDGYAGRPLVCDPQEYVGDPAGLEGCMNWISGVKQPHTASTCCGVGDAYIADEWEQDKDGGWVAIITRDYPGLNASDGEGGVVMEPGVLKGTRIPIPTKRIDDEHQGNPTGHGIVFFNWVGGTINVLCFFTKSLI